MSDHRLANTTDARKKRRRYEHLATTFRANINCVVKMEFLATSKSYITFGHAKDISPIKETSRRYEAYEPTDITFSPGRLISPCNDYGY